MQLQILNFDVPNNYSVMYITCCLNFDVILLNLLSGSVSATAMYSSLNSLFGSISAIAMCTTV